MNLKIGVGVQDNSAQKATKITQLRVTESDLKPLRDIVDSDEFNGSPWKGD